MTAELAILTRELMIIAFLPLAWRAWKQRRWLALRGKWVYPVTHGAVALAAISLCYGVAVFAFPGESIRVMAPTQMLLLIAACDRSRKLARPDELKLRRERVAA